MLFISHAPILTSGVPISEVEIIFAKNNFVISLIPFWELACRDLRGGGQTKGEQVCQVSA
jgi:hypothetical protein